MRSIAFSLVGAHTISYKNFPKVKTGIKISNVISTSLKQKLGKEEK